MKAAEPLLDSLDTDINDLERSIKEHGLWIGETVSGESLQAVHKTMVKWDKDKLDGYMTADPKIAPFRSENHSIAIVTRK